MYIALFLLLAAATAGLVFFMKRKPEEKPVAVTPPTALNSAPPPPVFAPPPPPKIEEIADAGSGSAPTPKSTGGAVSSAKGICPSSCGDGQSSPALNSALRGAAGTAQGCYNRAVQKSHVSGSMTVAVRVGSNGTVCGASIANDTVGSGEVSQCVLSRFKGRTFPAPQSGCVVVNIPISFTIKQ